MALQHTVQPRRPADCLQRLLQRRSRCQWQVQHNVFGRKEGKGSVPVTCETLRKRRKNKRAFAPNTRYRDTTEISKAAERVYNVPHESARHG
jgi:hypothetical protein